ncbi:hypothetical protein CRM22_006319 [Opisthorchis felineus]|uniref:Uncharacterized protein n=1 Tax=Opisthorchis felineus TaxID=147828 RepID=A0A4S2LLR2_OPIFE|nr:hypothetical protein CRM22_006319 [Opisthorchis felineus]
MLPGIDAISTRKQFVFEILPSMQINSKVTSFWTAELDGDDSSEAHPGRDELHNIFELDELASHAMELSLDERGTSRPQKPPMGRLRRVAPTTITGQQKLEFPGVFVQGFRNGHVDFNIPGILQDSLKPTDSIEVKINLFTPELSSGTVDPFHSAAISPPSQGFSTQTHNTNLSGRFNHSWRNPVSADRQGCDPTQVSTRLGGPIETHAELGSGSIFDTMYTDSQFSYSTIDTSSNRQQQTHRETSIHNRFGLDSTDSGLNLQFGNGQLEATEHVGLSAALLSSGVPSRFTHYHF